jgi:hypothetical protein
VLPPVDIGEPPKEFPFKLAGYTDVAPEEFVYARTPGGNWIAAATDPQGRLYMIDEVGEGGPGLGRVWVVVWVVVWVLGAVAV